MRCLAIGKEHPQLPNPVKTQPERTFLLPTMLPATKLPWVTWMMMMMMMMLAPPPQHRPLFPPTCDIFALKLELLTRSFCVDCPYPATLVWVFGWKTNRRRRWEYEVLHNLYLLFTLFFSCLCHVFSTPSCWFFSDAYLLIKLSF